MNRLLALALCWLISLVLVGGVTYRIGVRAEHGAQADRQSVAIEKAQATNSEMQSAAVAVEQRSAAERVRVVTQFQPIEREVIRYVQTHDPVTACLDDDGLRIWNAANRGEFEAAGSAASGSATVPDSSTDPERNPQRPAGEPRGSDAGLARMQATAGSARELDPGSAGHSGP